MVFVLLRWLGTVLRDERNGSAAVLHPGTPRNALISIEINCGGMRYPCGSNVIFTNDLWNTKAIESDNCQILYMKRND